jgi:hypothetical protein
LAGSGGYLNTASFFYTIMKYLLVLAFLAPLFFTTRNAQAVVVKIDSVYADSIYYGVEFGALNLTNPAGALGKPDGSSATFNNSTSTLDIGFRNARHTDLLPIKANSKVIIWGKKDFSVDTSAGQVVFIEATPDGALIRSTKPVVIDEGPDTLIVPSGGSGFFTYMEFSLAGSEKGGGAKSYLLNAVALVQDTTTPVSVRSGNTFANSLISYPNPFIGNTTIHFQLEAEGNVELAVVDALGREVDRISGGYMQNGVHDIPLAIKNSGYYFVRLFVNGQLAGSPLKITSR